MTSPDTPAVHTVIAYTRTADRTRLGSIQAQREDLAADRLPRLDREKEWIDDVGQPGTILERPGLTRALELLAHHQADALIACDATRLAHSAAVTRQLAAHAAAHGWQLVIVADDRQLPLFPAEPQDPLTCTNRGCWRFCLGWLLAAGCGLLGGAGGLLVTCWHSVHYVPDWACSDVGPDLRRSAEIYPSA